MPARVIVPKRLDTMVRVNKLFVYGIFLSPLQRARYGMTNPTYAIVRDYLTTEVSGSIVEAQEAPRGLGIALTGLVVDVEPDFWGRLDSLEDGYDRIRVATSNGVAWMYAKRKDSK